MEYNGKEYLEISLLFVHIFRVREVIKIDFICIKKCSLRLDNSLKLRTLSLHEQCKKRIHKNTTQVIATDSNQNFLINTHNDT